MPQIPVRIDDLRGMQRLAHDVVLGITDVVEAMHDAISVTGMLRARRDGRTRGITGLVYRAVRGVTRLSGRSADMLLRTAGRYVEDERASSRPPSPRRDALLAALNGLCGDYLSNTENSLAIPMTLRSRGAAIHCTKAALARAFPAPAPRLLVLVHGLCMNDLQWLRRGHDHGAALANDLGYTPLYLRYNTGRHISHNGRDFADSKLASNFSAFAVNSPSCLVKNGRRRSWSASRKKRSPSSASSFPSSNADAAS